MELLQSDSFDNSRWINGSLGSSNICFAVQAGATFHFGVVGATADQSQFHLRLQYIGPPPNDNFANAALLVGHHALATGNTIGATYESIELSGAKSIWWKWMAAHDGDVTVRVASFSGYASAVIYGLGADGQLNYLTAGLADPASELGLYFQATAGTTYYLWVASLDDPGPVEVELTGPQPNFELQYINSDARLKFVGPAGQTNIIDASTDLVHWMPLNTNANLSGTIWFSDPDARHFQSRFYRLRPWP